jgi:alkylation response protein AidB-like acyl-CoA dehydrogenase
MPKTQFEDADGTLAMLRESVDAFVDRQSGVQSLRKRRAAAHDMDTAIWAAMAEAGWTGLLIPETLGGTGLGLREQAVLSESLGRSLVTEPIAQIAGFSATLLTGTSPSAERDRLCRGIADGSVIAPPAWQGGDGKAAAIAAVPAAKGFRVSGTSHFVSAPQSATDFLLLCRSGKEQLLVSVPASASGISITTRTTIEGAQLGAVTFKDCPVPEANVLARGATVTLLMKRATEITRLLLAAELAGLASCALELAVDYTKNRVQFGKPIASFQAIQHRLVDMWTEAEFACSAIVNAVSAASTNDPDAATLAVLAAKARAGDAAVGISRRAIHLYGAMGFTDECDIGLYMKRAVSLNATLGNPEELRLQFVTLEQAN